MASKDSALAVVDAASFAIMTRDISTIKNVIDTNNEGKPMTRFDLGRVKVPAGGGLQWEVPSLMGPQYSATIDAVIVGQQVSRAYYRMNLNDKGARSGAPPDCGSNDGETGIGYRTAEDASKGEREHECAICPMAQFGESKPACKLFRNLYLLREKDLLPLMLQVPPTSLKAVKDFMLNLTRNVMPYHGVVTRLGLEKATNVDNITYGKLTLTVVGELTPEQSARMAEYGKLVREFIARDNRVIAAPVVSDAPAVDTLEDLDLTSY